MAAVVEDRKEVKRPKATPLPARQLAILCVVLLTESICSTMLIPFVGYYVSFMTGRPVEEAGYSVGYLVGFFMVGQVISSKMWGILSEKCGRKVGLVIGVFCCAVAMMLFGLSTRVYLCAFWRLVHGLSGGCSLVAKAMIADLTDRTNQAKGFALVSLTWGVGTLLGPSAGGALYNPVEQDWLSWLHLSKTGFLATHPAFLPCAAASAYNFFAVTICVLFLNETNGNAKPVYMVLPRCIGRPLRPLLRLVQPKIPGYDPSLEEDEEDAAEGAAVPAKEVVIVTDSTEQDTPPAPTTRGDADRKEGNGHSQSKHRDSSSEDGHPTSEVSTPEKKKHASFGFKQAFQDPVIRCVLFISMLISTSDMMYAEVFPLWAVASRDVGGLGLLPSGVSVLILVNCAPAILANMAFSRVLTSFTSAVGFWNMSQIGYATLTVAVPAASLIANVNAAYWYTMAVNMLRKVTECWVFAMIMLVVAQTAPPGRVSVMYGVQQATSCVVRALVPFVFAPVFAFSIDGTHSFPFNHWFVFLLMAIPLATGVAISGGVVIPPEDNAPTQDGTSNVDDGDGSHHDSMAHESLRNWSFGGGNGSFVASLHSFAGSGREQHTEQVPSLLMRNSFVSLAHSFANNIVPGILHSTIIPPFTDLESTKQDHDGEDERMPGDGRGRGHRHHHHHHHHCHHHRHHHSNHPEGEDATDGFPRRSPRHTRPVNEELSVTAAPEPQGLRASAAEGDASVPQREEREARHPSSESASSRSRSAPGGGGRSRSSSSSPSSYSSYSTSSWYDSREASSQQSVSDHGLGEAEEGEELPVVPADSPGAAQSSQGQPQHNSLSGDSYDALGHPKGTHHRHSHHHPPTLAQRHYEVPHSPLRQVEMVEQEDVRHSEESASEEDALPAPRQKAPRS